ncbi:MAG: hypothetical protein ACRDT8_16125 [Micromonosporaceae bacterium]
MVRTRRRHGQGSTNSPEIGPLPPGNIGGSLIGSPATNRPPRSVARLSEAKLAIAEEFADTLARATTPWQAATERAQGDISQSEHIGFG